MLVIGRNDPCWCGSGKKWKHCHFPHLGPSGASPQQMDRESLAKLYRGKWGIILKTDDEIKGIKASCALAVHILDTVCAAAVAGVTTLELDRLAHRLHIENKAIPAPLGYGHPPFPRSICTSINDVICHGIPDRTPLKPKDIVNIDVTCILNGYYGDCSRMVVVGGKTTSERQRVVDVAYECLMRAVAAMGPGVPVSRVGEIIEPYAEGHGCSVVTQFVGHGVGVGFHEPPQIPHYRNTMDDILLVPGMTFTIEPMINAGLSKAVIDERDHWTARTKDGAPSAQWEHTLRITSDGHEILTPWTRS